MLIRRLGGGLSGLARTLTRRLHDGGGILETPQQKAQTTNLSLHSRISNLPLGATVAHTLYDYIREGQVKQKHDLDSCVQGLRGERRFLQALQVMEWMERKNIGFSDNDVTIRLELIAKARGIVNAENYFHALVPLEKNKFSYGALLKCYCEEKMEEKAVSLFQKMKEAGVASTLAFNTLMSLYMKLGQPEKVPALVEEMSEKNIPLQKFTYNLLMHSYGCVGDLVGMERVYEKMEMVNENYCDWTTYSNLAARYVKSGLLRYKEGSALKKLQAKMGLQSVPMVMQWMERKNVSFFDYDVTNPNRAQNTEISSQELVIEDNGSDTFGSWLCKKRKEYTKSKKKSWMRFVSSHGVLQHLGCIGSAMSTLHDQKLIFGKTANEVVMKRHDIELATYEEFSHSRMGLTDLSIFLKFFIQSLAPNPNLPFDWTMFLLEVGLQLGREWSNLLKLMHSTLYRSNSTLPAHSLLEHPIFQNDVDKHTLMRKLNFELLSSSYPRMDKTTSILDKEILTSGLRNWRKCITDISLREKMLYSMEPRFDRGEPEVEETFEDYVTNQSGYRAFYDLCRLFTNATRHFPKYRCLRADAVVGLADRQVGFGVVRIYNLILRLWRKELQEQQTSRWRRRYDDLRYLSPRIKY